MNEAPAPILIGYDGSDAARRAIEQTAALFGPRRALVVTAWDPGLGYEEAATFPADLDASAPVINIAEAQEIDEALKQGASRVAQDGAELARSAGLQAEALAVASDVKAADAIVHVARERGVAAIVVGSRGLTGLRARLEGSTSSAVLKHAPCPVVVVHDD